MIASLILQNQYNYEALGVGVYDIYQKEACDIRIIIPVRGRGEFLLAVLQSLLNSDGGGRVIDIMVVEHSHKEEFVGLAERFGICYVHIPSHIAPFNKCLCMNMGALMSRGAKYLLFHDSDLMVNRSFLMDVMKNRDRENTDTVQCFADRKVLYCDAPLTGRIVRGEVTADYLTPSAPGVYDKNKPGAPGGSIFISRDLFFEIGGFTPEIFHSYSQEDKFFWDKMNLFSRVVSCSDPRVEVYHLDHPLQQFNNPDFKKLLSIYNQWYALPDEKKREIVELTKTLIEKYK